jgi:hypothetical protein
MGPCGRVDPWVYSYPALSLDSAPKIGCTFTASYNLTPQNPLPR